MSSFAVRVPDLDAYAVQLDRNGSALREGGRHLAAHSQVAWPDVGLLPLLRDAHVGLVARLNSVLRDAVLVLTGSADGLHAAAGWYRHVESASAAALDASYPAVRRDGPGD